MLEVGCGRGGILARLAERFKVTGVDLSREQLLRAKARAPSARLLRGDICSFDFSGESFDAVVAFYVLGHIPRERHRMLYRRVAEWLAPGGLLLASIAIMDDPGTVEEWLGSPMFFSSWPSEPSVTFQWVLARHRAV